MSNQALTWAQTRTVGSPTKKLVLLVLADYADQAWSCFPSQRTIARIAELSERAVRGALADLETDGWIRRQKAFRPDGGQTSDRIYLREPGGHERPAPPPRPDPPHPPAPAPRADPPPAPAAAQEPPVAEPPVEPPVVTSREQLTLVGASTPAALPEQHLAVGQVLGSDRDLAFVEFWSRYPHKTGKGQARKAWAAVRRRGVLPETIIQGVDRYAADPNRDPAYTKHPATWLNGECWLDEPMPDRAAPVAQAPRTAMGRTIGHLRGIAAAAAAEPRALGDGR